MLPVDGGSACDLRAAAHAGDQARQLTGLVPVAHRPDARAHAPFRKFHFREEEQEMARPAQHRPGRRTRRPAWDCSASMSRVGLKQGSSL